MILPLAFAIPFVESLRLVGVKFLLRHQAVSDFAVILAGMLYVLPFLLFLLARQVWMGEAIIASPWLPLLLMAIVSLEVPAQRAYHEAIKQDKFGYVLPVVTLKLPLIAIGSAFLFPFDGSATCTMLGVGLVFCGAALLQVARSNKPLRHWMSSLREATGHPSTRLALLVAVLWSGTTLLQRAALAHTSPFLFGLCFLGMLAAVFLQWGYRRERALGSLLMPPYLPLVATIGLVQGIGFVAQYWCLAHMNPASYMAIKETTTLWTLLWGYLIFGEKLNRGELCAIALVLAGGCSVVLGRAL